MKSLTIAIVGTIALQGVEAGEKCYALALSGGKEQAAYQAGVFQGLAASTENVQYDVISGVQGGAINAALISSFGKGNEVEAAKKLVAFWQATAHAKLYQSWWGGLAEGLLTEGGLYDNSPMLAFFNTEFKGLSLERALFIGLTDVLSGSFTVLSNKDLEKDNLIGALQGSFSFPGVFPPYSGLGSEFFDGTSIYNLDVFSAVNACLEKTGGVEEDVVVDVIMTTADSLEKVDASKYNSLEVLYRFAEISEYYGSLDGLLRAKFAYKGVNFRNVISPAKSLSWAFTPLSLTEKQINGMIAKGVEDATKQMVTPKDTDDLLHYYSLLRTKDEAVKGKTFNQFLEDKEIMPFANMDALKFLQI